MQTKKYHSDGSFNQTLKEAGNRFLWMRERSCVMPFTLTDTLNLVQSQCWNASLSQLFTSNSTWEHLSIQSGLHISSTTAVPWHLPIATTQKNRKQSESSSCGHLVAVSPNNSNDSNAIVYCRYSINNAEQRLLHSHFWGNDNNFSYYLRHKFINIWKVLIVLIVS